MEFRDLTSYLRTACPGTIVIEAPGCLFHIYDPDGDLPDERKLPFATIVTDDTYDTVSNLTRPDTYRLNLGLTKATYTYLFGTAPTERDEHGVLATGFDHATLDTVMPHPMYASQYWVCVVNPSDDTMPRLRPMIAEAYQFAVRKHVNHAARRSG